MDTYKNFLLTIEDGVASVTLNRPEVRNALDGDTWRELPLLFRALNDDPLVRVAILQSTGRHFSSGIDLGFLRSLMPAAQGDPARHQDRLRRVILDLQAAVSVLEEVRFPVIAAIQGACLGGGVDIVSAADIRVACADAVFRIEEINVGIVADLGTLQRLPRLIPAGIARELALSGRSLPAREAQQWGFVSAVLPDQAGMLAHARGLARAIADKSPLAVSGTKAVLNHARDHSVADGLDHVALWNAAHLSVDDVSRGLAAARTKSAAAYKNLLK